METSIKQVALNYLKVGISVIPVGGDKKPLCKWKPFQSELMKAEDAEKLFSESPSLGIVCGKVSGGGWGSGLEVMDFDLKHDTSGTLWMDFANEVSNQNTELWTCLQNSITVTKNGGKHLYYFCQRIEGNTVLASTVSHNTLIETRGEGGYVVAPPSAGYKVMHGDSIQFTEITPQERDLLHSIAKRFNSLAEGTIKKNTIPKQSGLTPWDDYNAKVNTIDLLTANGWTVVKKSGERIYLKRPGESDAEHSGNYHEGLRLFYCHSTSTQLPAYEGLTASAVLTYLQFNGDFHESAKYLKSRGYGDTITLPASESIPAIATDPETDRLRNKLESCRVSMSKPVSKPIPFITIQGKTISTAGNLTTFIGQAKSGKSALIQSGLAGSFNADGLEIDTLGLEVTPSDGKLVLHFDTEQSMYDHHYGIASALKRNGLKDEPKYFKSYNITGQSGSESIELLNFALKDLSVNTGGVHSIWLDGPADYVNSVNDEKESNAFITGLMLTARAYNCPVILSMHYNPGNDTKGRGHLGSALERKSESVISVTKSEVDNVSKYEPLKGLLRHASGFEPMSFKYCLEKGYHLSNGVLMSSKLKKEHERKELMCEMWNLFNGGKAYFEYSALCNELMSFYAIQKDTAKKKIGKLTKEGVLEKNYDLRTPIYRLNGGLVAIGGFSTSCT